MLRKFVTWFEHKDNARMNLTKEWLIYFRIPSRIFENMSVRKIRNVVTDKRNMKITNSFIHILDWLTWYLQI